MKLRRKEPLKPAQESLSAMRRISDFYPTTPPPSMADHVSQDADIKEAFAMVQPDESPVPMPAEPIQLTYPPTASLTSPPTKDPPPAASSGERLRKREFFPPARKLELAQAWELFTPPRGKKKYDAFKEEYKSQLLPRKSTIDRWAREYRAAREQLSSTVTARQDAEGAHLPHVDALEVWGGHRGPKPKLPEEDAAAALLIARTAIKHSQPLRNSTLRELLFDERGCTITSASMSRLLKRHNVSLRATTTAAQGSVPESERPRFKRVFLARVAYVMNQHGIDPLRVIVADETAIHFRPRSTRTLHPTGAKTVSAVGGEDNSKLTAMLATTMPPPPTHHDSAFQFRLPPFLIIKGNDDHIGKRVRKEVAGHYKKAGGIFRPRVYANKKAWMDTGAAIRWLRSVVKPFLDDQAAARGLSPRAPALLVWDVQAAHYSAGTVEFLRTAMPYLHLVFIPPSATPFLQCHDATIIHPLKAALRRRAAHSAMTGFTTVNGQPIDWGGPVRNLTQQLEGARPPKRKAMPHLRMRYACWTADCYNELRPEIFRAGFSCTGLAAALHPVSREPHLHIAKEMYQSAELWASLAPKDVGSVLFGSDGSCSIGGHSVEGGDGESVKGVESGTVDHAGENDLAKDVEDAGGLGDVGEDGDVEDDDDDDGDVRTVAGSGGAGEEDSPRKRRRSIRWARRACSPHDGVVKMERPETPGVDGPTAKPISAFAVSNHSAVTFGSGVAVFNFANPTNVTISSATPPTPIPFDKSSSSYDASRAPGSRYVTRSVAAHATGPPYGLVRNVTDMTCGTLAIAQVVASSFSSGKCGPLDQGSTHPAILALINAVSNQAAAFDGNLGKEAHAALGRGAQEVVDLHSHFAAIVAAAPSLREYVQMRVLDCFRGEEASAYTLDINLDSCVSGVRHQSIQSALTEKLTPHDWNNTLMETKILSAPACLVVELFRYHERDRPVESRTPVSINQTVVLPPTSGGFKYHLRAVICGDKRHWWAFVRYGAHWFCADDARIDGPLLELPFETTGRQASLLWLEKE